MPPSYKLTAEADYTTHLRQLAWGAAWRITAWGVGLGAALGGIIGGVLFLSSVIGGSSGNGGIAVLAAGALFGAAMGGVLGLLEGMLIGGVLATNINRSRQLTPDKYMLVAGQASLAGVAIMYVLLTIGVTTAIAGDLLSWLGGSCLPLLVNAGAAWLASTRVATWMVSATEAYVEGA